MDKTREYFFYVLAITEKFFSLRSKYIDKNLKANVKVFHPVFPSHFKAGPKAYSHHDKFPPWWESVHNDDGGNPTIDDDDYDSFD